MQPRFLEAVAADARTTLAFRASPGAAATGWRFAFEVVRLLLTADAFFAQVCYRARVRLYVRRVPILPGVLHHLSMSSAQVCIGDPVWIGPGLYLPHGQVVIDGFTLIHPQTVVRPFVTIGLNARGLAGPDVGPSVAAGRNSRDLTGPNIGPYAEIGTGAKLIGNVRVGRGAVVGANAVVLCDVPDDSTVVGAPARVVNRRDRDWSAFDESVRREMAMAGGSDR